MNIDLITLLRNQQCTVEYQHHQLYNENWTDSEICNNVVRLNCGSRNLSTLPALPICEWLYCNNNRLITLPTLPKCQTLYCGDNQLTALPDLPNCQQLYCNTNRLTALPNLPNCKELYCNDNNLTALPALSKCLYLRCWDNQLNTLPELPNCQYLNCEHNNLTALPALPNCLVLDCRNNRLPLESLLDWQRVWKLKEWYLQRKYFSLWHNTFIKRRKGDLHLELIWSPDTGFYKDREEYRHFISHQKTT